MRTGLCQRIDREATLGEKVADAVAGFGGSWTFIISFGALAITGYTLINIILRGKERGILTRLSCSIYSSTMLASVQAPVIMMSQNRQDKKDRVRSGWISTSTAGRNRRSRGSRTKLTWWRKSSMTSPTCFAAKQGR